MYATIAASLAMLAMVAGIPAQAASADARFKALYSREWTWREEQFAGQDDEDDKGQIEEAAGIAGVVAFGALDHQREQKHRDDPPAAHEG